MIGLLTLAYRRACLRAIAGGLFLVTGAGCSADGSAGPSTEAAIPADSVPAPADTTHTAPGDSIPTPPSDSTVPTPTDSTVPPPADSTVPPPADSTVPPPADSTGTTGAGAPILDNRSPHPGIVFGSYNMENPYLTSVHTGSLRGGGLGPTNVLSLLADGRAKKARFVIKLVNGRDSFVKNADGTFSLTKWKALVDRFKTVNIAPYIADGTIVGHFLIDEPHLARKWGGKIIPQATIEAMAKYSKQIWPDMTTFVRAVPSWLVSAPVTYVYLDAGWAQYAAGKGDVTKYVTSEIAAAKSRGLGLMVGMNVFGGGDGSSGTRTPGYNGFFTMSAAEIRKYATVLLNQSYACGFYMWTHDVGYYGRSDVTTAMAEMSAKAKTHAKTSCRQ